jgi:hypothetical protein
MTAAGNSGLLSRKLPMLRSIFSASLLLAAGCGAASDDTGGSTTGSATTGDLPTTGEMPATATDPDGSTGGGAPEAYVPPRIVAGYVHTCALSATGGVRCWGDDSLYGVLGNGSIEAVGDEPGELPPPDVALGGAAVQIATGDHHMCALMVGGTVRCWGDGNHGVLGAGNEENIGDEPGEMPPPEVDVGGEVVQIAAGLSNTCALLATGAVRCWGLHVVDGMSADIGDEPGEMPPPDLPLTGTVVQLHGSSQARCVVRDDGTVACWDNFHVPAEVPFGGDVVQLAGDLCARRSDGAIQCMGINFYGELGYGHTDPVEDAVAAGDIPVGGRVTRLAASGTLTCAILEAGNVRCWGGNDYGQLGYGHTDQLGDEPGELPTPDIDLGGPAQAIAVSDYHVCGLLADDTVRCWGSGYGGLLGYGMGVSIGDDPDEMPPPPLPVF